MPFQLHTDPHRITIALSGVVTVTDLGELSAAMRVAEARYSEAPGRLIDLSGVDDFHLTFSDVFARAKEREARTTQAFKTAVLVASPVQRGFGRMYQAIVMHPRMLVEVFEHRLDALAWLEDGRGGVHSAAS